MFWLAGLLEGEGSFLRGPPSNPNKIGVKLDMKDEDIVLRASHLMQVRSYQLDSGRKRNPKWSPIFRAIAYGRKAYSLMNKLCPIMGLRRKDQINIALASYEHPSTMAWEKRYDLPADAELLQLRSSMSWRKLATHLGVSFVAVRRRVAKIQTDKIQTISL